MACNYCIYRNSWDCGDGYNRRKKCSEFKLDWDALSDKDKKTIQKILENREKKLLVNKRTILKR